MKYQNKIANLNQLMKLCGNFPYQNGKVEVNGENIGFSSDIFEVNASFSEHSSGVISRRDTIKNKSDKETEIHTAHSRFVFNNGEYEVYTQYSEWCNESNGRWQELCTEIGASGTDVRSNASTAPFIAIFNKQTGRGMAFHLMADSTWVMKVKKEYVTFPGTGIVIVDIGIDNANFNYRLGAGETLALPEILFYEFKNKTDIDAYKLHRYCRVRFPARSFPIVYNSWMSKYDKISFDILSEQLEIAKKLGCEYFVIDAGWFGPENSWFGLVGDWREYKEASMMGRMGEFADKVRSYGLKFGLWFEIERANATSNAYREYPEHYLIQDPDNKSRFVNFADPDTCEYIFGVISEQIRKYNIEFIKFDFNDELFYDVTGNSFVKYSEGYRGFMARLKTTFPTLYLQCCAGGGLRMSLSNIVSFDSFWMSDNHSLYAQLDIFKNTLKRMPSRSLETWLTVRSHENFGPVYNGTVTEKYVMSGDSGWNHNEYVHKDFMLNSSVGGPLGISCDLTRFSDQLVADLAAFIEEYKSEREFWQNSECHILTDTETMLVLEFCDGNYDEIKIFTYSKVPIQSKISVYPICSEGAEYSSSLGENMTSAELDEGFDLPVKGRYTTNKVTFTKIKK